MAPVGFRLMLHRPERRQEFVVPAADLCAVQPDLKILPNRVNARHAFRVAIRRPARKQPAPRRNAAPTAPPGDGLDPQPVRAGIVARTCGHGRQCGADRQRSASVPPRAFDAQPGAAARIRSARRSPPCPYCSRAAKRPRQVFPTGAANTSRRQDVNIASKEADSPVLRVTTGPSMSCDLRLAEPEICQVPCQRRNKKPAEPNLAAFRVSDRFPLWIRIASLLSRN